MAVAWCSGFCRYLGIKFLLFLWLIWPWGTPHYSQFALITKHRKWRGDSASGCVIYFWNLKFPRQVWKEIGFAGKSVSPIPVCDTQTFSHPSISKSGNRLSVFLHCVSPLQQYSRDLLGLVLSVQFRDICVASDYRWPTKPERWRSHII